MKKIPSVFKRNYEGDRLCYPEFVESVADWITGPGVVATEKWDGTACAVILGKAYARYDRKVDKRTGERKVPDGIWFPAQPAPDSITAHWPGWLEIRREDPTYKHHVEAFERLNEDEEILYDGTYELVGPKVQGNPYGLDRHELWRHGASEIAFDLKDSLKPGQWFSFWDGFLSIYPGEGIVFYGPDAKMAKVKRTDYGHPWPVPDAIPWRGE